MKRLVRPLFILTVVSFMLGLWFSLSRFERSLVKQISEPPIINLLTYSTAPWQHLHMTSPVLLRVNAIQNTDLFEQALRSESPGCDVVAIDSLTARFFIENHLLKPWRPEKLKNSHLIGADFRSLAADPAGTFLFPLFWTMAEWRKTSDWKETETLSEALSQPSWKKRINLQTPVEDQLAIALDLGLATSEVGIEEDGEILPDINEPARILSDQFLIKTTPSEAEAKKVQAIRRLVTTPPDPHLSSTYPLINSSQLDFWVLGLGLCAHSKNVDSAHVFLDALLEDPSYFKVLKKLPYATTLTTGEHQDIPDYQKPSLLRAMELARIQQRELSWALMRPWLKKLAPEASLMPKAD